VADAGGLAAVSMSRVAAELGFTTMSLYRYVASKDELLLLMVNSATRYEEPPRQQEETWREAMRDWTLRQMQAMREHIWFVQIPITGVPVTPSQVVWIEHGLRALAETGLTEHEKADIVGLLASYALGQMRLEFEVTSAQRAAAADGQTPAGYAAMMAQLIGAEDYPAMHAAVVAGAFEDDPDGDRELVDFGLERILDGIEVLIERRSEAGLDGDQG
jgi:AcrR family transcriptional regulator